MDHRYIVVEGPSASARPASRTSSPSASAAGRSSRWWRRTPSSPASTTDRQKFAFQTQLFFLLCRFKQQQELFQQDLFSAVTVSDYLFAKDRIFACLTLTGDELALYERVFDALGPRVTKPDLVIYLQARLDVLLTASRSAAGSSSGTFDAGYLEDLVQAYNDFFFHYSETPLLVINTSDIDFVNNDGGPGGRCWRSIRKTRKGTQHYLPAGGKRPELTLRRARALALREESPSAC